MRAFGKFAAMAGVAVLVVSSAVLAGAQEKQKMVDGIPAKDVEKVITPGQIPPPPAPMGNPATGAALYEQCTPCHGLDGKGIAGKTEADLMASMQTIQTNTYTNPKAMKMQTILRGLSQEQLADLARYISKM